MTRERDEGVTPGRLATGMAAGIMASVVQVAIGEAEDLAFLPRWEDSHFAPRLVDRLAERVGIDPSPVAKWGFGTAFHLGYAAWWGGAYSAFRERVPVRPATGGLLLGGLIYGITFSRWGGAVQIDAERPPELRTRRMDLVDASVALGFGLCTSLLYERMR